MKRTIFRCLYSVYCYLYRSFRGKRGQYNVLINCPQGFHFFHLRPVVLRLAEDPRFDIRVVADDLSDIEEIPNVKMRVPGDLKDDFFRPVDMFLTTGFRMPPWWFVGVKKAFFLHGIGPKVSYFVSPKLKNYDFILPPSPFVEEKQRPIISSNAQMLPIGLPALDEFVNAPNDSPPKKRPVLLYAPSWSSNPEHITADRDIIEAMINQDVCDCIIRPHPLLMSEGPHGVPDIKNLLEDASRRNPAVKLHSGPGTSVYDVLPLADILMSDISSVLYEFLVFDRPILLYLKDAVAEFYDAEEVIEQTRQASFMVTDTTSFKDALSKSISQSDLHATQRRELRELMLYNPGKATDVMVDFLTHHARQK